MILWAEIADNYCRQMLGWRAAQFCRAVCTQHSPDVALLFCLLSPNFEEGKRREGAGESQRPQISDELLKFQIQLFTLCGSVSTSKQALLIVFPWKWTWQTDCWLCISLPSSPVSPCLPDLTRSTLFFRQPVGPNQRTLNHKAFQLTVPFPPMATWSIRRVLLHNIHQLYLGITKQKNFLPVTEMLCHSLSNSVRVFILAVMLLPFHSYGRDRRAKDQTNPASWKRATSTARNDSQSHSGG